MDEYSPIETPIGQLIYYLSRGRLLNYPEERPGFQIPPQFTSTKRRRSADEETVVNDEDRSDEAARKKVEEGEKAPTPNTSEGREPSGQGEQGPDHNLVDWYGPDDPENPQNWPLSKKVFATFLLCLLTFSVYIGSSIFSGGETDLQQEFGIGQVAATLGLSTFVIGYGVGPMHITQCPTLDPRTTLGNPRDRSKPSYILTLIIFVVLQVPTALCGSLGALLPLRFLAGFFGSPVFATGGASIADMTIWILLWLSGFTLVVLIFNLPETSSANILARRARRLRKLTGNKNLKSAGEIQQEEMSGKEILLMSLVRPFTMTFLEPICFFLNLYIGLVYAILYVWFQSFALVFVGIYGFNGGQLGLSYMGLFIGAILTYVGFCFYAYFYLEKKMDKQGVIIPEQRLPPGFVGCIALPISLFWFGWASRASVHWIVPIVGSSLFSVGAFLLFQAVLNYLPDVYPKHAASVLAGNDFFRAAFGAGFPLFANAMYTKLGIGWASSLLGFLSIAMILIPFVLYRYGKTIRGWSKMAE